jgi:hypothetical protein
MEVEYENQVPEMNISASSEKVEADASAQSEAKVESKSDQDKLRGRAKIERILGESKRKAAEKNPANNESESPDDSLKQEDNIKPKKQPARERIKNLTNQRNEALNQAENFQKERDNAIKLLEQLQRKNAAGRSTQKELIQEVMLEQQVDNMNQQRTSELLDRIDTMPDPEEYKVNYEYYTPILEKYARNMLQHLIKYDNYPEVLNVMFNAINNGTIDLRTWIQKPLPVQLNEIKYVSNQLKNNAVQNQPGAQSSQKTLKPSITPDLQKKQSATARQDKSAFESRLDKYRVKR